MKKGFWFFVLIVIITFLSLFAYEHFKEKDNSEQKNNVIEEESKQEVVVVEIPVKEDINIKMSAIGDIMCHNSQYIDAYNSNTKTYDFSYVFTDIQQYVSSADIAVGNLETTFAGKEVGYSNYPTFNTPEQLAQNLKDFGIDVLSTVNNHSMDKKYDGLVSTLNYLDAAGISHTGTYRTEEEQNQILVKDVNGIKIAFIAFTYGTNGIPVPKSKSFCVNLIDEALILKQIELAKQEQPDLICASMHWGIEYQKKQNSEQDRLANLLFENGVDIILGSHPHVLQPMEKKTVTLKDGTTKDCFVIYSLGNFMSGQTKENTRSSVILNIDITKNGETGKTTLNKIEYIPIYMYKASTASIQKYKILDIEKTLLDYENGKDKSIGQTTYTILRNELSKIKKTMGNSIIF